MVARIRDAGRLNSLAQTLMKYTSPGVPDLYQGSELWDLSLVDPDNRRPVDYQLRQSLLREIKALPLGEITRRSDDGLPKLWTIHQSLLLRREHPDWFGPDADYRPLEVTGRTREHVIAYARGEQVVTVVPRLTLVLDGAWQASVTLPEGTWINRLTGEKVPGGPSRVDRLFAQFPVALLVLES